MRIDLYIYRCILVIEDWPEDAVVQNDREQNEKAAADSATNIGKGLKRLLQQPVDDEIEAKAKKKRWQAEDLDMNKFRPNRELLALLDGQMKGCGLNLNDFIPERRLKQLGGLDEREFRQQKYFDTQPPDIDIRM